jgi:hypothetical protein
MKPGFLFWVSKLLMRDKSTRGFMLNDRQAVAIYKQKLELMKPRSFKTCLQDFDSRIKGQSTHVGKAFGVSPKTIRDIWSRRTWSEATSFLWGTEKNLEEGDASSFSVLSRFQHSDRLVSIKPNPVHSSLIRFSRINLLLLSMPLSAFPYRIFADLMNVMSSFTSPPTSTKTFTVR